MGISGSGGGRQGRRRNGWTSQGNLERHFNRHGRNPRDRFSFPNSDTYHQGAWNVINNANTITGTRPDIDDAIGHFNPRNDRLVITNERNQKITFHRLTGGRRRFDNEFPVQERKEEA